MADLRDFLPSSVLRQLADEGYGIVKIEGYTPDTKAALQGDDMGMALAVPADEPLAGLSPRAWAKSFEDRLARLAAEVRAIRERLDAQENDNEPG